MILLHTTETLSYFCEEPRRKPWEVLSDVKNQKDRLPCTRDKSRRTDTVI